MAHRKNKNRTTVITIDDLHSAWIQAGIKKPAKAPDNYVTSRELQNIWGIKRSTTTDRIKRLISEQKIDDVKIFEVVDEAGRCFPVKHYHLKGT